MNVKLRAFESLARQDALAFVVNFEHVALGFLARPAEHHLKHVRDIHHQIDRIIPANDKVPGVKSVFRTTVRAFLSVRLNCYRVVYRCHDIIISKHTRNFNQPSMTGSSVNPEISLANPSEQIWGQTHSSRIPAGEHSGAEFA